MSESTPIPVAIMPATHTPETLAPHVDAALRGLEESDHLQEDLAEGTFPEGALVVLRVAEEPVYDAATGQQIDGYAHAHHVHARLRLDETGARRAELIGHVDDGVAR